MKHSYIYVLIASAIATCAIAESEATHNKLQTTSSRTIIDLLPTIDTLWEADYKKCCDYLGKLKLRGAPFFPATETPSNTPDARIGPSVDGFQILYDGLFSIELGAGIAPSNDALRMLFEHTCRLPILSDGKPDTDRLRKKWETIHSFPDSISTLKSLGSVWLDLATVMGDIRVNLNPDYDFLWHSINGVPHSRFLEETDVKNPKPEEYICQLELRWHSKNWRERITKDIRNFAQSLTPDERKQFLDKIKELARSDDDEAKLLDEPIPVERPGLPVEFARSHAARLSPAARKQFLNMAKGKSDYTEEELKILEAPFE